MKDNYYLYISEPISRTIIESQVVNWLQLFQQNGFYFDLFTSTPLSTILNKDEYYNHRIQRVKNTLKGKVYLAPAIRKRDKTGISSIIKFLYLLFIIFMKIPKKKNIIIQTRNLNNFKMFKIIRVIFPKVKIIFEFRGAGAEEYINALGYHDIKDVDNHKVIKKYSRILSSQKKMFKMANIVICVSEKLKEYVNRITDYEYESKLFVIPGAADKNQFKYDPDLRDTVRNNLGLTKKFVLIYSGRLDTPWQMKEFMFNLVGELMKDFKNLFFLCLTPDVESGKILALKYNLDYNRLILKYIDFQNIYQYYCAADLGLMLREDTPTNNVSSPTKLPEYLLCGLPVLISEKIGDYSNFVKNNNCGYVVKNDINEIKNTIKKAVEKTDFERKSIKNIAINYYSKQSHLEKYVFIFKKIVQS